MSEPAQTILTPRTTFQSVTLRAGPHAGQTMRVPVDQDTIELVEGRARLVYRRINNKPELWFTSAQALRIGGAG